MTTKKSKHTPYDTSTTKWFITAASVAAILGGWAVFSSQTPTGSDTASQTLVTNLSLEPVPTLVSPPDGSQNEILTDDSSASSGLSLLSTLRSVNAPRPVPMTITRSSR